AAAAAGANLRLQAVSPASTPDEEGKRQIVLYRLALDDEALGSEPAAIGAPSGGLGRTGPWAAPLLRSELAVEAGDLPDAVAQLLATPPPEASAVGAGPAPGQGHLAGPGPVVDVLICTHGRRDTCCGSKGTELVASLIATPLGVAPLGPRPLAAEGAGGPRPELRLWRTSHTGGHRFAPTAIVLPDGTLWAWATPGLIAQVAGRSGDLSDLLPNFRGSACLGSADHQALERAVLAEVGWDLLTSRRLALDVGGGRARLETEHFGSWEAVVREGRRVPQPDCRTDPREATKFGVEWVVEGLKLVGEALHS
ncbi:MAG TPA: sucrase ferredoxin, partial [Acidimicrobiales bacterium]|nr:sucrase ferredoxin [Acidimicrobiales bacterium]